MRGWIFTIRSYDFVRNEVMINVENCVVEHALVYSIYV